MNKAVEDRRAFVINFIYFSIFVVSFYFIVNYALGYIFPFVFAAVLAVVLQKPVRKISSKLHIKAHGAISTILVLLIVSLIVGLLVILVGGLVKEIKGFLEFFFSRFNSVNDVIVVVEEWLNGILVRLPKGMGAKATAYVSDAFENLSLSSMNINMDMLSEPLSGAWDVVKGIPSFLLSIVITIISCVFMTSEYDFIRDMILSMLSPEKGKRLVKAKKTVLQGVGKLVKAYVTIMLITFTEVFIGLNLMKALGVYGGGYIAIIAFITCIVDIIPVLGTGTVLIPWAIFNILTGDFGQGIGLIVLYVVITVLRQVLEPKLVANQAGLPSVVSIMAMFLGARLFGALGVILTPLTIIILKLMYDEGIIGARSHQVCEASSGDEEKI
jgi:sporulation integral membrane protein YtvI